MNGLTEQQVAFLQRYGFDAELQQRWQEDIAAGRLSKSTNAVTGDLLAPPPGTLQQLPGSGTKAWRALEELGRTAIARGELGVVVLNGGMATRFGGVVKGVVPVLGPERTFLALAIEDVLRAERCTGGHVPMFFMNSFTTDEATRAHLVEHEHFGADNKRIECFTQFIALRMDTKGKPLTLENGEISPYGPGHGDFAPAFRGCGALQRFLDGGGRYLLVKNVDNVGARVDAVILGHHIESARDATVELAPKWPEDVGGSPFLYEGRTQLVEQVRYPPGFDPNIVGVFNTNTFTFTAQALDCDFDLGRYYVEKTVEDRRAVQIEHLIGELTAHLSTSFLKVRRSGRGTRFLPVKTPKDLHAAREEIAEMYDGGDGDG
ncbi:MAG: UTP--glucose-1-phosphate uridylyltransferase, partial [Planctomycetota bacterium]